jgi:NADPH-dependent 2,4-dienoyl-CoA reductase/sulfur reductase-like enzyme
MLHRYLIVGTGVAALAAAESICSHDPSGEIMVVGDDPHGYYSRPGLAYYLNQSVPQHLLFPRRVEELHKLFPKRIHARVTELLPDQHEVVLHDGRHLRYDRLLLATGSVATPGDFPGNDLRGVVKLDTLGDVHDILRLARHARTAVVVGGGIIAIELAEGLAAQGLQVHYFLRGDRFWASVLDETESRIVERGLEAEGIRLHYRTLVAQAQSRHGRLIGVVTKAGGEYSCQMLGVAIGLRARMELAQRAGLATNRGILVDEYLETSTPDVYAAGDVAEMRSTDDTDTWYETLWPKARNQGEVAGANMAGARSPCAHKLLYNAVRIGGIITTTIGTMETSRNTDPALITVTGHPPDAWYGIPAASDMGRGKGGRVRIVVGERRIVGALVMGDQSPARPLKQMIETQVDIAPIRPFLQDEPTRGVTLIADWYSRQEGAVVKTQP